MCICEYKDADKVGGHLRRKHQIGASSKKYKSNIILLSATYHDCQICGTKILRNRHEIRVHVANKHKMKFLDYQAWLPDGDSRVLRSYVLGPPGFWTMAPLRYAAKYDPFRSLDCAPTPSTLAQSKERKGSNFAI